MRLNHKLMSKLGRAEVKGLSSAANVDRQLQDEKEFVDPNPRVLAKDGLWLVPVVARPKNWERFGLKELPMRSHEGEGTSPPQTEDKSLGGVFLHPSDLEGDE